MDKMSTSRIRGQEGGKRRRTAHAEVDHDGREGLEELQVNGTNTNSNACHNGHELEQREQFRERRRGRGARKEQL